MPTGEKSQQQPRSIATHPKSHKKPAGQESYPVARRLFSWCFEAAYFLGVDFNGRDFPGGGACGAFFTSSSSW
ncbi:hypothetical protein ABTE14_19555, partial [Acinetobacter baumannii]